MSPQPTGTRTPDGRVVISRRLDAAPEETWSWITDPDRTARWFGRWSGDPASGRVAVQLSAEEGAPTSTTLIRTCEAPRRLVIENGLGWVLALDVEADGAGSVLTLSQVMDDAEFAASVGPGWEFYLDRLVTARAGGDVDAIVFEPDYVPGQSAHYRALFS
ncbi:SRPBCC domain-containing protein [Brachybacterium huguangmaarense]|uniref:SRPBCC domain-containing protein n=1 Tax=Brachybacterium huguangmaarense TaxID=1652028 RepID=A0ABY6G2F3_9MICO|nr:SRPBCC domain-containing protein [Brachybacterium huguangmaarense]UYG17388.1 SRPBCC domain-containing protein [Brachybacterium huguangmaarense]